MAAIWCDYRLLQIDALMAAGNAVLEMLLQSYNRGIKILPALPDKWTQGEAKGLRTYNGFEMDIQWENHKLQKLTIHSLKGKECKLQICCDLAGESTSIKNSLGETVVGNVGPTVCFNTQEGMVYELLSE